MLRTSRQKVGNTSWSWSWKSKPKPSSMCRNVPLPNNWLRLPFSKRKREGERKCSRQYRRERKGESVRERQTRAGIGESVLESRKRSRVPSTTELNCRQTERQTAGVGKSEREWEWEGDGQPTAMARTKIATTMKCGEKWESATKRRLTGRMDNMDYNKSRWSLFPWRSGTCLALPSSALPCFAFALLMLKAFFVARRFARKIQARFARRSSLFLSPKWRSAMSAALCQQFL